MPLLFWDFLRLQLQKKDYQWGVKMDAVVIVRIIVQEDVTVPVQTIVLVHVRAVKATAMVIVLAIAKKRVKVVV